MHGVQAPRIETGNRGPKSQGPDCVWLAGQYGLVADPWQSGLLDRWLSESARGKWSAGRCGLSVPRQNGKNAILEMLELYAVIALGYKVLHTAHEVKTARKAFTRLRGFFEDVKYPELSDLLAGAPRQTNGQEAILLKNGGSVEFVARSRGSGRGFTADILVCDEAQELTDEQLEALLPTISSAPAGNPLQIYTGTPPPPNSPGTVFKRMRDIGVEGKDKRLFWSEWSVDEIGDIGDRKRWEATNPALGIRLQSSVIADELSQMSSDGFARERLGWWMDTAVDDLAIRPSVWRALESEIPDTPGIDSFGVKFAPGGGMVALGACRVISGTAYVEAFEPRAAPADIQRLAKWLAPRVSAGASLWIDGAGGRDILYDELRALNVPASKIVRPNVSQIIAAHTLCESKIVDGTLRHPGQPGLTASVGCAGKRSIGTRGGWGWKSLGGDILPLESITMAIGASVKAPSVIRPGSRYRATRQAVSRGD